ncbi:phage baseplate assembly protein V [Parerythrobacter aestuarii]|uniref:phage baseplate assembly protein V n=1 Tax=Parerythrobacter aestuarii TaxID=3020909 RepID=UPI0024DEF26F|nr:phage baseplate assembly protein V [Parerythrobacter aestuarii]
MTVHTPLASTIAGMSLAYGEVINVDDPQGVYRVQVKLHGFDGPENQDSSIWARVIAPFAGNGHGAVMLPDVGHQVVVGFVAGDRNYPIVLGALYTGEATPAEEPVDGGAVKRWALTGSGGTQILMDESGGSEITMETAGGVKVVVTDAGTKVEVTNGSGSMIIEPSGVSVQTGAKVTIDASTIEVNSGMVTVNAGLSKFSGVVQCDTMIATTVVASTYTPGAGNIW